MYTEAQRRAHIDNLQRFLRRIQRAQGHLQPLAPDGLFGAETAAAVRDFQRQNGLPVTGTADYDTWTRIYAQYLPLIVGDVLPTAAVVFPPGADACLSPGARGAAVLAVQMMLNTAAPHFSSVPPVPLTGVYDADTTAAVRRAQTVFLLPVTGVTELATWEALALFHNSFAYRTPLPWLLGEQ